MRFNAPFSDSDLARFAYETERRSRDGPLVRSGRDLAFELLRSTPNPRDRALTSLAAAWRDAIQADRRPTQLCDQYPRVANRLALCWDDPELTERIFKDLLNSRRGSHVRRGFPGPVLHELHALRQLSWQRQARSA